MTVTLKMLYFKQKLNKKTQVKEWEKTTLKTETKIDYVSIVIFLVGLLFGIQLISAISLAFIVK